MVTREEQNLNRVMLTFFIVMAIVLGVLWYGLHVLYESGAL